MFDKRKLECMKKLEHCDKSKKGSVDEKIKQLVEIINSKEDYYTTSSCSGRIILIAYGERKCDAEWLYVNHDKAEFQNVKEKLTKECWLKMEPMIMHVACRNIESAEKLLKCVRDAGFKRSGIISTSNSIIIEIIGSENVNAIVYKDKPVNESYLKILLEEANKKLQENHMRISKLEVAVNKNL